MSTIVTRAGKGSPLTHTEVDNNFTNLNTDKLQSGNTAASLTITSADINGGTIDGTSVGASTASTGAFTTATASTSFGSPVFKATSSAGGALQNSGGTNQLQWGGGGGNNLSVDVAININPANAQVAISPTGTGSVTINPATAGTINNMSVGATTASTGAFTTLSATGVATVSAGTVSAPAITTTGDTNTGIFFPAADTIAFTEGGTEAMRIDSSGNLGIGTASPITKLEVGGAITDTVPATYKGTIRVNSALQTTVESVGGIEFPVAADGYGYKMQQISSGGACLAFAGRQASATWTERMRLDAVGNLGIGTSSPAGKLGVSDGTVQIATVPFAAGSTGYFGTSTNHPLGILTNNTERMRIDSSGNLLVGTTTTLGRLTVTDTGSGTVCTMQSGTTAAVTQIGFANPNGYVGSITTSGSSTAYNTSSDYRLKENILPMTGALATVQALKPVTYNWKIDGSNGQGFIAHELQEVCPSAVSGEKDAVNEDGSIKAQGIDTSFLVATLTAAIQEQQAMITQLQADVAELKGQSL